MGVDKLYWSFIPIVISRILQVMAGLELGIRIGIRNRVRDVGDGVRVTVKIRVIR
jgi:hypothetical protein